MEESIRGEGRASADPEAGPCLACLKRSRGQHHSGGEGKEENSWQWDATGHGASDSAGHCGYSDFFQIIMGGREVTCSAYT